MSATAAEQTATWNRAEPRWPVLYD